MSLIEIDTALIFAGYLGFSILNKTGSVDEIEKHLWSLHFKDHNGLNRSCI